jgi:hypothetical protein
MRKFHLQPQLFIWGITVPRLARNAIASPISATSNLPTIQRILLPKIIFYKSI